LEPAEPDSDAATVLVSEPAEPDSEALVLEPAEPDSDAATVLVSEPAEPDSEAATVLVSEPAEELASPCLFLFLCLLLLPLLFRLFQFFQHFSVNGVHIQRNAGKFSLPFKDRERGPHVAAVRIFWHQAQADHDGLVFF